MKKLFLTAAVALTASLGASAQLADASIFDNATWYNGSSWTSKVEMENNSANSLTIVFGVLNNVEQLSIPNYLDQDSPNTAMKVKISGPENYSYSAYPMPITYQGYDDAGNYGVQTLKNGVKLTISAYGVNKPGEYTCVFPAGCMKADGEDIKESTVVFYVNDTRTFTPTDIDFRPSPDPDFSVNSIPGVSLRYDINYASGTRRYTPQSPSNTVFPYFQKEDGTKLEAKATNVGSTTGTGCVDIIPNAVITEPGKITLVVPEGVIRLSEISESGSSTNLVCNKALSFVYTVSGGDNGYDAVDMKPVITPTPGTVAKLSQITFESPKDEIDMYLPAKKLPVSVKSPDGTLSHYVPYTNPNVEGLFAYLDLGENCTTAGTYSFTVPRGCFEYWDGSKYTINKEFSFNYQLAEVENRDFEYTANPASGSTVYVLYDPTVTFVDKNLTFSTGTKATLVRPNGDSEQIYLSFNATDSKITIGPIYTSEGVGDKKVEYYGEYKVTIPSNTVVDENGAANNEFTLTYNFAERQLRDIAFTVNPAEGTVGTQNLETITLTAPDDIAQIKRQADGIQKSTLRTPTGDYNCYIKEVPNYPLRFRIEPEPDMIKADGEYAWIIPENAFRITLEDGTQCINEMKVFTWTVYNAGVEDVFVDGVEYDVYTLDGKVVLKGASAADLAGLKGFYVINGKNYFLK